MAQRRRMEVGGNGVQETRVDVHSIFQSAANDLSKLYSFHLKTKNLAFEAGQKRALEKVHEWLMSEVQEGKLVTTADIITFVQDELNKTIQEAWGLGSNQPNASENTQNALGFSSPAPLPVQSQESDGKALTPEDFDMDIGNEETGSQ